MIDWDFSFRKENATYTFAPIIPYCLRHFSDYKNIKFLTEISECMSLLIEYAREHQIDLMNMPIYTVKVPRKRQYSDDITEDEIKISVVHNLRDYYEHYHFDYPTSPFLKVFDGSDRFSTLPDSRLDPDDLHFEDELESMIDEPEHENALEKIYDHYEYLVKDPSYHKDFIEELDGWISKYGETINGYTSDWNEVPGFKERVERSKDP